jgi:2-aminobenzoate-CoA ligase
VLGDDGDPVPDGTLGPAGGEGPDRLPLSLRRAPEVYVPGGWNVTGDTFIRDADGYFWYQARSDDMIISAGYNIAGPEVETALLAHDDVVECGVVGAPDEARGQVVQAYVVLRAGVVGDPRSQGAAGLRQSSRSRRTSTHGSSSSSTRCRAPTPASSNASPCARSLGRAARRRERGAGEHRGAAARRVARHRRRRSLPSLERAPLGGGSRGVLHERLDLLELFGTVPRVRYEVDYLARLWFRDRVDVALSGGVGGPYVAALRVRGTTGLGGRRPGCHGRGQLGPRSRRHRGVAADRSGTPADRRARNARSSWWH